MNENELQAVIRGERQAVRDFIREFGPMFRQVVRQRVVGAWREREEDLLQDILTELFAHNARVLRAWDAQKGRALKTFLKVFAHQRTIDWLRRQRRSGREEPTEDAALLRRADADQDEPHEAPDWLEPLLTRFRSECSAEDQRIIELSYIDDLSVREIAVILNLTEANVYQRRHRIKLRMLKLKQELSEKRSLGS